MKLKRNFREYIFGLKSQAKKDNSVTLLDCESRGESNDYQRGFHQGYVLALNKLYDDCKDYEWKKQLVEGEKK